MRHEIAFGEGAVPADVVFIGEGPGKSEDILGRVWIGAAGKLLRRTITKIQVEKIIRKTLVGHDFVQGMNLNAYFSMHPLEEELPPQSLINNVSKQTFTYYLTNLVCCHPTDEISGSNRQPTEEETTACFPRLAKQIELINPKVIIALGKVPFGFVKKKYPGAKTAYHPSYIIRSGGSKMKGSIFVQWYRQLEDALHEVIS